jgi:hypothetical protein
MKQQKTNFAQIWLPILLVAMVGMVSGCSKLLDTERQGSYDEESYPFPGGSGPYDQYIFGAYNDMRAYGVHVFAFLHATSIRSDDADKGSTPADGGANAQQMDNFPVLSNNGFTNELWVGNYGLINKCNNTLFQISSNPNIVAPDDIKIQTSAEARFLRAYGYFNLVRFFGNVPLIDTLFQDPAAQNNVPQSTAAQIYTFIENELNFAASILPATWDPRFVGRATRGAALGLLAKVYITQGKWALAQGAANSVMTSGVYDLSTPYARIFSEEGENSKESVFEVQATATPSIQTAQGVQYSQVQGVRGAGDWNYGWGFNVPSQRLADAYEAGDPRRARTILFTSTATTPGVSINGQTTPIGLPNPMYNHKVHPTTSFVTRINSRGAWWMNIRLLRYADVVLMFAEAANEVGGEANITAARSALNLVRARARAGNNAILPDVITTDQALLRTAIRHERRVELGMEHDRFFDIVRWGISGQVMLDAGKTNYNESRDKLLPIPQTQIDLSGGVLKQNPGY